MNLFQKTEIHYVQPGEVVVTSGQSLIHTVLGSCVSVCLWDKENGLGGMNHIALPICREDNSASARFANVATYVLYDMMLEAGSQKHKMHARVFGGANGLMSKSGAPVLSVGSRNVAITYRILKKINIPVVGKDVGGNAGRKLEFDLSDGKIQMRFLQTFDFSEETKIVLDGQKR